ncbi:hypothetical protein [Mycobacterium sp.]|uniref:hypothetical protein n=1 Tax=Mycobacterium sp. TaxID=1785 RepID=UPI003D12B54E
MTTESLSSPDDSPRDVRQWSEDLGAAICVEGDKPARFEWLLAARPLWPRTGSADRRIGLALLLFGTTIDAHRLALLAVLDEVAEAHQTTVAAASWRGCSPKITSPHQSRAHAQSQLDGILPAADLVLNAEEVTPLGAANTESPQAVAPLYRGDFLPQGRARGRTRTANIAASLFTLFTRVINVSVD